MADRPEAPEPESMVWKDWNEETPRAIELNAAGLWFFGLIFLSLGVVWFLTFEVFGDGGDYAVVSTLAFVGMACNLASRPLRSAGVVLQRQEDRVHELERRLGFGGQEGSEEPGGEPEA
jgi:apolipoprotein N-acyltransferase